MSLGRQLRCEPVRTLAAGSMGSSYVAVGGPVSNPDGVALFQNLTDAVLMFSFDGINDHFPLASSAGHVLDITTNQPTKDGMYLSVGTQFYVKNISSPTTGSVYITLYYGRD
jgi:hypothetical protein